MCCFFYSIFLPCLLLTSPLSHLDSVKLLIASCLVLPAITSDPLQRCCEKLIALIFCILFNSLKPSVDFNTHIYLHFAEKPVLHNLLDTFGLLIDTVLCSGIFSDLNKANLRTTYFLRNISRRILTGLKRIRTT